MKQTFENELSNKGSYQINKSNMMHKILRLSGKKLKQTYENEFSSSPTA